MSRHKAHYNENIYCYYGSDHAIGNFFDLLDRRFEGHDLDETGEGFLLEWCNMFGITTNLIGATMEDLESKDKTNLMNKVEKFISELPCKQSA